MRKNLAQLLAVAILVGVVCIGLLLPGATANRHRGNYVSIMCGPVDLAVTEDFDLCTFDVPQRMVVESVQGACDTVGDDPGFIVTEGGVAIHVEVPFVADDPQFATLTDTNLDDEDEIVFNFVADAGDTATWAAQSCSAITLVGR